jgi:hypothetical protein
MPESRRDSLALQGAALRYAAGDLPPAEVESFEARLAVDQRAREALAEAIRLSAAALGQHPPAPDCSVRALVQERLQQPTTWFGLRLARRSYRGHPAVWAVAGAGVVAAATLVGLHLVPAGVADLPATVTASQSSPTDPPPGPQGPPDPPHPNLALAPNEVSDSVLPPIDSASCAGADGALRAAELWAEMSTPEQVEKNREDELRLRTLFRDTPSVLASPSPDAAEARDP